MKALLLAAGLGTRLRPITDTIPKCLVPIAGRPLLGIWLDRLRDAGVSSVLINTHYLADQVREFLRAENDMDINIVHEEKLLGTAGTILKNIDFFESQPTLLIHADNYCAEGLVGLIQAHNSRPQDCVMTMMTFRSPTPESCGVVELDEAGRVKQFHEKVRNPPGNLANAAVYVLAPELLEELSNQRPTPSDFSTEVIYPLVGRIYTYETNELFADIGTPEAYRSVCSQVEP